MESIKEGQTDVKEQADKITADINALSEKITALFKKKDATRDEYYKAKFDYELQRDKIFHLTK